MLRRRPGALPQRYGRVPRAGVDHRQALQPTPWAPRRSSATCARHPALSRRPASSGPIAASPAKAGHPRPRGTGQRGCLAWFTSARRSQRPGEPQTQNRAHPSATMTPDRPAPSVHPCSCPGDPRARTSWSFIHYQYALCSAASRKALGRSPLQRALRISAAARRRGEVGTSATHAGGGLGSSIEQTS
jgi:hypothetical protein